MLRVPGFQLALTHTNSSGTIHFTTDGRDPRAVGGAIAGMPYTGPIMLSESGAILARVRAGTNWSALRTAIFNTANHAGAVKVTEIMYQPKAPSTNEDAGQYEFLELGNRSSASIDLSGCFLTGIDFRFKPGTVIGPSNFMILVRNAVAFTNRYPGVAYHGIYWGGLDKDGERIRLKNAAGTNLFSVEYNDAPPWPLGANGFGWSLVNANPQGDADDSRNWRASRNIHGSPGAPDPEPSYGIGVVINEVLSHTDPPQEDAVELFNPTRSAIDISGWWLSDQIENKDPDLLKKYRISADTIIPAGGYKVLYESNFNSGAKPFALSSLGDQVYLASADALGSLSGYIVGAEFGASDNGVSFGRFETSVGVDFTAMQELTLDAANSEPRIGPVMINEIMYHPTNGANEFIEFHNLASTNIDLSGWMLEGANFVFPSGTFISSNGLLVLVGSTNIGASQFRAQHNVPAEVPILTHAFDLENAGEALVLSKPNDPPTNAPIAVDRVRYNDKGAWPVEPDGFGPSLEKISPSLYGNEPLNWRASRSGGSPGRPNPTNRNSLPGATYLVQHSSDLRTWTDAGSAGTAGEYREPLIAQERAKFFRVREL